MRAASMSEESTIIHVAAGTAIRLVRIGVIALAASWIAFASRLGWPASPPASPSGVSQVDASDDSWRPAFETIRTRHQLIGYRTPDMNLAIGGIMREATA